MNLMKKFLVGGTWDRVRALGKVRALLLPASNLFTGPWGSVNSFYFPMRLARGLSQKLCQIQDPKVISKK